MSEIEIYLNMDKLDELIKNLDPKAEEIVRKMAFAVEAGAKRYAPVDTGALMNSIYSSTSQGANPGPSYPGVRYYNLPPVINPMEAYVGPSVDYAIYQEFGTYKMAAHPYLFPALFEVRARFNEMWEALFL